jgi:hypothetical protein
MSRLCGLKHLGDGVRHGDERRMLRHQGGRFPLPLAGRRGLGFPLRCFRLHLRLLHRQVGLETRRPHQWVSAERAMLLGVCISVW